MHLSHNSDPLIAHLRDLLEHPVVLCYLGFLCMEAEEPGSADERQHAALYYVEVRSSQSQELGSNTESRSMDTTDIISGQSLKLMDHIAGKLKKKKKSN